MDEIVEKIAGSKVLMGSIYKDLVSPGAKQAGIALETVFELSNSILLPVKLLNETTKALYDKWMLDFKKRISVVPENEIIKVHPDIGLTIVDKFTCVTDEDIARLFSKLLASASNVNTADVAHPSFITAISKLTPDEARILTYIKRYGLYRIPSLTVTVKYSGYPRDYVCRNSTAIEHKVEIQNKKRMGLYFDNLMIVGLIAKNDLESNEREQQFNALKIHYKNEIDQRIKYFGKRYGKPKEYVVDYVFSVYEVTEYGKVFLNACVPLSA